MKKINSILILILLTFVFNACEKEETVLPESENESDDLLKCGSHYGGYNYSFDNCGEEKTFDFYSVADVIISNNNKSVTVSVITFDDWVIAKTFLYAGNQEDIPYNEDGIPDINEFSNANEYRIEFPNTASYEIPIQDNWDDCIKIILKMKIITLDEEGLQADKVWSFTIDENKNFELDYCIQDCKTYSRKPNFYKKKWYNSYWRYRYRHSFKHF